MLRYHFRKKERLKRKKRINELFSKGYCVKSYPFKILYCANLNESHNHRALFAVPGRNIKKAADRNKIKRRIKEAYRIHKNELSSTPKLLIGFIYIAKEILPYSIIQKAIIQSIQTVSNPKPIP